MVDSIQLGAATLSSIFSSSCARDQGGALPSSAPTVSCAAASLSRRIVCRVQSSIAVAGRLRSS